jgi:peptidyl-prolyl cis-trans isomerase B (cyclophilin B)
VSPTSREREYARRRYEKWQTKQAARYQRRRQQRRYAVLAAAAAATIVVIVVVAMLTLHGGSSATTATPSTAASATAGDNPCPKPAASTSQSGKSWSKTPAASLAQGKSWTWTIETSCGPILATLDGAKAPQAVASTIFLSQQGFYNSTPCHRLTTEGIYVLQCGDPTGKGTGGPGYSYGPVENAPKNNVYAAGTIAMARQSGKGTSMGSQFFLVYKDSTIPSDTAGGYTVIGKITGGLGTLEKVAAGGADGGTGDGAPTRAVSILSAAVAAS